MNKQELKKILPHGYTQKIADKLGVHRNTVTNCLNGKTDSPTVELAILEALAELKEKRDGFMNIING